MQGGVGAFSQIIASTLAAQGHDIHVLTHADAEPAKGVTLTPVKGWGVGALAAVRDWARREQLDVVNLQFQTAAFGMSPWVHFLPDFLRSTVPFVTTFHDLRYPYLLPKAGPLRNAVVRHLAKASAGVIVTNAEDKQALAGLPHVHLIPIGSNITATADPDIARQLRVTVGHDAYVIGFFGFMHESKGLPELVDALAILRTQGIDARLVLIGGRTGSSDPTIAASADAVEAQIARVGVGDCVHFTGFVDEAEVANWLAACDVVALPYRDGASYRRGTLMAAIQHGAAIVTTTPTIPIPAFVEAANMRFVPPNDADALAVALRRLYEHPEQRERLHEGTAALRPLFDWKQIARETAQFFESLV